MKIGHFSKNEDSGEFEGRVETLTLCADLRIVPEPEKSNDKAPDYRIVTANTGAEIGAGWNETAQESGNPYLSLKLDDPSFPRPIWAALTKSPIGELSLYWTRRKANNLSTPSSETI